MVNDISKKAFPVKSETVNDVNVKPIKVNVNQSEMTANGQGSTQETSPLSLVSDTVNRLNEAVQSIERDLKFQIDEESGETVITVLDTNTNEVIRQIPTEEVLAVRENIETLKGLLFSAKV